MPAGPMIISSNFRTWPKRASPCRMKFARNGKICSNNEREKNVKSFWVSALLASTLAMSVQAQEYPNKSIRVLVSFAPGGVVDTSTRIVTSKITEALNWHFVVDNRPGANG